MKRYVALLRGINIGGKNKISMPELKQCFIAYGYIDVLTHLNSGNVVFSCDEQAENNLAKDIRSMINEQFELDIPVFVISQSELKTLLSQAPVWWGTDDQKVYDNLILVMPPATAEAITKKIGDPAKDLEWISIIENVIFWSFDRNDYAKTNWWKKTASMDISEMLTIRTANTIRKIVTM